MVCVCELKFMENVYIWWKRNRLLGTRKLLQYVWIIEEPQFQLISSIFWFLSILSSTVSATWLVKKYINIWTVVNYFLNYQFYRQLRIPGSFLVVYVSFTCIEKLTFYAIIVVHLECHLLRSINIHIKIEWNQMNTLRDGTINEFSITFQQNTIHQ